MVSPIAMLLAFFWWQEPVRFEIDRLEAISMRISGRLQFDMTGKRPAPDELSVLRLPQVQTQLTDKNDELPKLISEMDSEFPTNSIYFQPADKIMAYHNTLQRKMRLVLGPIDLFKVQAVLKSRAFYASPADYLANRGIDDETVAKFEKFFRENRNDVVKRLQALEAETFIILFADFPVQVRNDLVALMTDDTVQFPSPSALRLDLMKLKKGEFSKRPSDRTGVSYRLNELSEMEFVTYTQHDPFSDFGEQLAVAKFPKSHPIWSDFQLHHELAMDLGLKYSNKRFEIEKTGGSNAKIQLEATHEQYVKDITKITDHILSGLNEKEQLEFRRSRVACEVVVFGPSSLFHNERAWQTLNFKFEDKHRKLLQKSAPDALDFLLKETQKFERELLIEACKSAGDESIPEKHFVWLNSSLNSFPPIELLLRSLPIRR